MVARVRRAGLVGSALLLWLLACAPAGLPPSDPTAQAAPPARPTATTVPPPRPTSAPPALSPASSPVASPPALARGPAAPAARPRVGLLGGLGDAGVALGRAEGFFVEQGLEPVEVRFDTPSQMLQAFSSGQLEAGSVPVGADLFNALAAGVPIKIVAEAQGAPPGQGAAGLIVRPDLVERLRTPTDLRGFRVGLPARGGGLEAELAHLLRQGWLARTDLDVVVLPPADLAAALVDASLDGAMLAEPLLGEVQRRGLGRVWRRSDEILPNRLQAALVFSARFVRTQPDGARRFMTAYLKAARLYNDVVAKDAADRGELVRGLGRATRHDPAALAQAILPGINPNGMVNVETLRRDQVYFVAHGLQQRPLDLPRFIDARFTVHAITQLGEYR